jgi:hypothetical protein
MIQLPEGYFWDPEFQLGEESQAIAAKVWPRYLVEDSDISQADVQFEMSHDEFRKRFPAWGIRAHSDDKLVAYANAVFLKTDLTQNQLPDGGWRDVIEAGARREIPNCLSLVVANVDPEYQSLKLSYKLIEKAKETALRYKIKNLIAPVRPSHKHLHPGISIHDYIQLHRPDGALQDPWLRAHQNAGGQMLNVCSRSVEVRASIKRWTEWTGHPFSRSGEYELERGLAPLVVDSESGVGVYVEPNVWFIYHL